jgi:Tol biopolymer transport system component
MSENSSFQAEITETSENNSRQSSSGRVRYDLILGLVVLLMIVGMGAALFLLDQDEDGEELSPADTLALDEGEWIIYQAPSSSIIQNLYLYNVETDEEIQLTDIEDGVVDYALSPDGQWVAFTMPHIDTRYDIWTLNLQTRQTVQMTNCAEANATCSDPSWSADGSRIAYTRQELSSGYARSEHVWIVDVQTLRTEPIFPNELISAFSPLWSPTGEKLSLVLKYPDGLQTIMIIDFATGERILLESLQNVQGTFGPAGERFIFPVYASGAEGSSLYTHLEMANLEDFDEVVSISGDPSDPWDDSLVAFHPDGERIALVRRYLDERYTQAGQLYLMELATGEVEELIVDPSYSHSYMDWNAAGDLLVMKRYDFRAGSVSTEIWLYDLETGDLRLINDDADRPTFIP